MDYKRTILVGRTPKGDNYPVGCPVEIEITMLADKEIVSPYLDTQLRPCSSARTLSMTGAVWQKNRYDGYCFGQIEDEIARLFPGNGELQRLLAIWKEWHLNDMHKGTDEQEAAIKEHFGEVYNYDLICEYLKERNLYEVGPMKYKYGHAWLVRPLPVKVWAEVERLAEAIDRNPK